jgi:hypothetical protein
MDVNESHRSAWKEEIQVLREILAKFDFKDTARVLFEFPRPAQGSRRVGDTLLLLPSGAIAVLEFKGRPVDEYDQRHAIEDALYLKQCHSESHDREVRPFLVLPRSEEAGTVTLFPDALDVASIGNQYQSIRVYITTQAQVKPGTWDKWENGTYHVPPSILRGTAEALLDGKIPEITGEIGKHIDDARDTLVTLIAKDLKSESPTGKVIVVVGDPGAGKTLLGVTLVAKVHECFPNEGTNHPVLFSGNGPLVAVLKKAISKFSKSQNIPSFIQDAKHVKKTLPNGSSTTPSPILRVFDEAQRAWVKDGNKPSELEQLWEWVKRNKRALVLLVGKGQAIHNKEMTDSQFWRELQRLHLQDQQLPLHLEEAAARDHGFVDANGKPAVTVNPLLRLKNPIRQLGVGTFAHWVDALLEGRTTDAAQLAEAIRPSYPLYLSKNEKCLEVWATKYFDSLEAKDKTRFRYGWFESSKSSKPPCEGFLKTQFEFGKMEPVADWYMEPYPNQKSCCALTHSCTEFSCQGLELDLALLAWRGDFWRRKNQWTIPADIRQHPDFTTNVYRVLLTRGRRGLLVRCADDETFRYLRDCGMVVLP